MDKYSSLLSTCLDSLKKYNTLIDKHLTNQDRNDEKTRVKKITEIYCQADFNLKKSLGIAEESVKEFENQINPNDTIIKLPDFNELDDIYHNKLRTDRTILENVETHEIWKDIIRGESNLDVEAIEPNRTDEPLPESAYEQMNDSVLCSNVFTPPIDPITKTVIREPYKNKKCGHIYEYQSILQYIKSMKNRAKCPYIGCNNNNISVKDLKQDNDLKRRIDDYLATRDTLFEN